MDVLLLEWKHVFETDAVFNAIFVLLSSLWNISGEKCNPITYIIPAITASGVNECLIVFDYFVVEDLVVSNSRCRYVNKWTFCCLSQKDIWTENIDLPP